MKIYVLKRKYRGEKQVKVGMTQNSVTTRLSYAGGGWKIVFSVERGDISKKKTLKYEGLVHKYLGKHRVKLGRYKEIFSCDPMYAAAVVQTITEKSIMNVENHLAGPRYLHSTWFDDLAVLPIVGWLGTCFYHAIWDGPWMTSGEAGVGILLTGPIIIVGVMIFMPIFEPISNRIMKKSRQKIKDAWNTKARAWDDELTVNMLKLEK